MKVSKHFASISESGTLQWTVFSPLFCISSVIYPLVCSAVLDLTQARRARYRLSSLLVPFPVPLMLASLVPPARAAVASPQNCHPWCLAGLEKHPSLGTSHHLAALYLVLGNCSKTFGKQWVKGDKEANGYWRVTDDSSCPVQWQAVSHYWTLLLSHLFVTWGVLPVTFTI